MWEKDIDSLTSTNRQPCRWVGDGLAGWPLTHEMIALGLYPVKRERLVDISNWFFAKCRRAVYLCRHLVEMDEIRIKPLDTVMKD